MKRYVIIGNGPASVIAAVCLYFVFGGCEK